MTEQEVEAMAKRLERVWEPKRASLHTGFFGWYAKITDDVELIIGENKAGLWVRLGSQSGYLTHNMGRLVEIGLFLDRSDLELRLQAEFADEWRPFFRRCCWLSGCSIEASADEKAKWIQGFSREELEAWNLTI